MSEDDDLGSGTLCLLYGALKFGTQGVVDLATPDQPYLPQVDWDAGFTAAAKAYSKSIASPDLLALVAHLRANFTQSEIMAMRPIVAARAMPIWEQEEGELSVGDVVDSLVNSAELPRELHERVVQELHSWQNKR